MVQMVVTNFGNVLDAIGAHMGLCTIETAQGNSVRPLMKRGPPMAGFYFLFIFFLLASSFLERGTENKQGRGTT